MPSFSQQNKTSLLVTAIWNYRPLSTTDHGAKQVDNSYYKNKNRRIPGMKKCFRGWNFAENLITPKGHFKHMEMKDHSTHYHFSICKLAAVRRDAMWNGECRFTWHVFFYSPNQRMKYKEVNINKSPKRHSLLINNQQITESRLTTSMTVRVWMQYSSTGIGSILLFYGNRLSAEHLPFISWWLTKLMLELRTVCPAYINTNDKPSFQNKISIHISQQDEVGGKQRLRIMIPVCRSPNRARALFFIFFATVLWYNCYRTSNCYFSLR